MFENIGHVLYHVLIILFPILFYHQFLSKGITDFTKRINYEFLMVLLIMLIFTMSFPIEVSNGDSYDQKIIPIILAFIYGGWILGITLMLAMLGYLFILEEPGFLIMVVNYAILAVLLSIFSMWFQGMKKTYKIMVVSILFLFVTLTRTVRLILLNEHGEIFVTILVSMVTLVTLITVMLIIENLNMQMNLQRELQRSEKLKVVSELAASVAHEVRNPMTSTRGFLQLMSTDENLNESQKKYIEISIGELDRAQAIIQDYLSLAKPNKMEFNVMDLTKEIENVVQLMSTYTNIQNITFLHSIEDELYIKANKDEVKQVLINIIKNGIEAIGEGGTIKVHAFRKNDDAVIEVSDDGIGMSPSQLSRIGTPFYSTKDMGTGIGLTISFQIIQLLKGRIDVSSEYGKGTTFWIRIPLAD
ncbi:two-component system sporulation sensor kinase B [Bacillus tianshenii]|uniref:histidine kinase n=1 Tax=Sutcliffiella tianshenii TaxID=1463404 RepID=A0ABS2P1W2_9BACI|nr:ATP-binding protein [Bacillus tianshenii]MBM7620950.1 two-component system sporulation sensor kinase B [Bacillus tianshenii]